MKTFGSLPFEIDADKMGFPMAGAEQKTTIFRNYALGPIFDQKNEGICVDCSLRGLLAAEPIRQSPFKPREIYHAARQMGNVPKSVEGAQLNLAVDFLKNEGIVKKDYWTRMVEQVGTYLNDIAQCVLTLPWYDGMNETNWDGRVTPKGHIVGFHAILAFRYDGLKERVWLRNSWGSWGRDGNCYVTMKDLDKMMKDGGMACAIVE